MMNYFSARVAPALLQEFLHRLVFVALFSYFAQNMLCVFNLLIIEQNETKTNTL